MKTKLFLFLSFVTLFCSVHAATVGYVVYDGNKAISVPGLKATNFNVTALTNLGATASSIGGFDANKKQDSITSLATVESRLGAINILQSTELDSIAELETLLGAVNVILATEIDTLSEIEALAGGANIIQSTEIDTLAELETLMGSINIIAATEIDSMSELEAIVGVNLIASTEIDTIGEIETLTGVNIIISSEIGTVAAINALTTDDDFATLLGSQTLANKTLTTPTIGSFANATHTHANAAGGGTLDASTALGSGTIAAARLPAFTGDATTTAGAVAMTLQSASSDFSWASVISPTAISANQNDYNPTGFGTATVLRLSTDATRNITGLLGQEDGEVKFIENIGSNALVLKNADAGSIATNRFKLNADVTLLANQGILVMYDLPTARWRAVGGISGGTITGPGSSTDNAMALFDGNGGNTLKNSAFTAQSVTNLNVPGVIYADSAVFTNGITIAGNGPADFQKGIVFSGIVTPPQITSNQNDYNPTGFSTASELRLDTDASRNITGLVGQENGRIMRLVNVGSSAVVLQDANTGSVATNRFLFGADLTLGANQSILVKYDLTSARWRPVTGVFSGSGAPTDAHYLTTQAEAGLSQESNLGGLTTGLLKISISAGVATPSTAVLNTDYLAPTSIDTIAELETLLGSVNVILATEIDTEAELEALVAGLNFIISTEINTVAKIEAIAGGANIIVSTEIDTLAELETLMSAINIIASTEIDTLSELNAIVGDADLVAAATTVSAGAGMSGGGDLTANRTLTWAPDTFVGNVTLWDSANATRTFTVGLSGATDPVWTYGNNSADLTAGVLKYGGNTVATAANNLSVFAATTSAQLDTLINDNTGSGLAVFQTTPTLITPVLGVATATSVNKVAITAPATSATLTIADGKTLTVSQDTTLNRQASTGLPVEFCIVASDETTALTAAAGKVTFRAPYAFTVTALRCSVNTAPTGATILVDVNESGTTIISTKLMIDATEKTSTTATTPYVISDSAIADDAEISIDIDQIGSTIAGAGLKVWILGYR